METLPYLQAWRLHKGLTQKELAKRSGLTQAQVSTLENQTHIPTLKTLNKLAAAFGVPTGELLNLPPTGPLPLSRHDIDAVALAIVSGERNLNPGLNRLAASVASIISQKLNAFKAPGRVVNRGKRWGGKFQWFRVRRMAPEAILNQILARVDKSLP